MTDDEHQRLAHGISLSSAPHELELSNTSSGYWFTYRCYQCGEEVSHYVGEVDHLIHSERQARLMSSDIEAITQERVGRSA